MKVGTPLILAFRLLPTADPSVLGMQVVYICGTIVAHVVSVVGLCLIHHTLHHHSVIHARKQPHVGVGNVLSRKGGRGARHR